MDDKDIAIEGFHDTRKDPQIQRETASLCMSMKLSATRLTEFEKYLPGSQTAKNFSSPGWVSISKSFRTCKLD